ncbi:MAG: mandelate racemase/muconate lactonizing enzyme family protein [Anaerolineaceae bacterium]|nr:mandelate racemase/muconate lactonizing enzyme family protein [Anaerolineaceae bacterium]
MIIQEAEIFFVSIPVTPVEEGGIAPYRGHDLPPGEGIRNAASCLVKVTTREGITGWGETNAVINPVVQAALFQHYIRPLVLGMDCLQANARQYRAAKSIEPPVGVRGILSGIDMACWDAAGKALGLPVYTLLGGKIRDRVDVAYCLGLEDLTVTAERVQEILDAGYHTIKTTGGNDVAFDLRRAELMRQIGADRLNIRVDMNEAYDFIAAAHFLSQAEPLALEYVEQPLRVNQFNALAELHKRFKTPIAVNEDCYVPHNLFNYVQANAIDAAVVDMDPLGGITELVRIADLGEEAGLPLIHHCGFDLGIKTAAILQVYAAKPAFSRPMDSTYMTHQDDILPEKLSIRDGAFTIPDGPGLGIVVDEDKVRRFSIQ